MTTDEEARLWQAEMAASRVRYGQWLKEGTGTGKPNAVARAQELVREAQALIAESRALRSRNR